MTKEPGRMFDQAILSTWQDELKATNNPNFKQQCLQREPDLLPRFAEHYEKLKTLPRRLRRSLQRQWQRSLAGVALLLALGQAPALAATINVGGTCTLVRAIVAANNNTTASGNCRQGSGADTIVLPSGSTQRLATVNNTLYGPTGLPVIRSAITIVGKGSTISRANSAPGTPPISAFRLFSVGTSGALTLQATTVSGGLANPIRGNQYSNDGGGALVADGSLRLIGSTISGNTAAGEGGGVFSVNATTSLINSTVSGNTVGLAGGGLYSRGSTLNLADSTISGNSAEDSGGGVWVYSGALNLVRTLISGNSLPPVSPPNVPHGREVYIYSPSGTVVTAGNFNLFGHDGSAGVAGFSPGNTDIPGATDIVPAQGLAAILNPTLTDNGGPTQTHALMRGSRAVDAVSDSTCPPPMTDQRGVKRPQDGNGDGGPACDISAYELTAPPPITETCAGLTATIVGTPGNESIPGTPGPDVIDGLGGVDQLSGLGGNDVLCGGEGNDTILSGPGNDRAFGEIGNDLVHGGGGADQINGAGGADQLFGDEANDQLTGGTGTDRCNGGSGTDTASTCERRISMP
jgi:Ca2+-binding RTX toxin-like protein